MSGRLGRELGRRFEDAAPPQFARGQVIEGRSGEVAVAVRGTEVPTHALGDVVVELGDPVLCVRFGQQWYVLGLITPGVELYVPPAPPAVAPPPAPVNPTPAAPSEGWSHFTATESRTWTINEGQWNNFHGRHLVQGSWSGRSYAGHWWLGTGPRDALKGRTILESLVKLPARYRLGNYNAPATLHLYLHDQPNRGGRPNLLAGPHDVVVQPGFGGGWVHFPTGWGQAIVDNGGGLAIQGEPYAGLIGVGPVQEGLEPESGQIKLRWSRP